MPCQSRSDAYETLHHLVVCAIDDLKIFNHDQGQRDFLPLFVSWLSQLEPDHSPGSLWIVMSIFWCSAVTMASQDSQKVTVFNNVPLFALFSILSIILSPPLLRRGGEEV